jgi:ribosomal protein S18 acetylase RimI-like enzyme
VLARAFDDDPAWTWILPDPRRRARLLPWLFRTAIEATLAHGRVDTTAGEVRGAALWVPPDTSLAEINRSAARALLAAPLRLRRSYRRFREYAVWNSDVQARARPGPSLFLSGLGVDPEHRRQGIAGALLEAGVGREHDAPALLLTNTERNLALYRRHGFEVVLDAPMPHGLPCWAMLRHPPR